MWLRSIGSTEYITYWSIDFCRLQIEYLRNISWNEEIVKFWPYSTILAPNVTFLYSLILLEICWPSFTLKTFSLFLFQFSWKALNRILHLRKPLTSNQSDDLHLAFFKNYYWSKFQLHTVLECSLIMYEYFLMFCILMFFVQKWYIH